MARLVDGELTMAGSWAMDSVLLAWVGYATRQRPAIGRLLGAAAVGTALTMAPWLAAARWAGIGLVAAPCVMTGLTWGFRPWSRVARLTAWFWAVTLGVGGAVWVLTAQSLSAVDALGLSLAAAWAFGALVRPSLDAATMADGVGRVRVWWGDAPVELSVLWDTGNRLRSHDGRPVMVVELKAIPDRLLPATVRAWYGRVPDPLSREWSRREGDAWSVMRITSATGQRWLPVVPVARAEVEVEGRWVALKPLSAAFTDIRLAPDGAFQAILSPLCRMEPVRQAR